MSDENKISDEDSDKTSRNFVEDVKKEVEEANSKDLPQRVDVLLNGAEGAADTVWTGIYAAGGVGCKLIAWGNDAMSWGCKIVGADEQAKKFEKWSDKYHNKANELFNNAGDKVYDAGVNLTSSVTIGATSSLRTILNRGKNVGTMAYNFGKGMV